MREVYRGNGFVVSTNDCGEIFVGREETESYSHLRISAPGGDTDRRIGTIRVSYMNTSLIVEPTNYKTLDFRRLVD